MDDDSNIHKSVWHKSPSSEVLKSFAYKCNFGGTLLKAASVSLRQRIASETRCAVPGFAGLMEELFWVSCPLTLTGRCCPDTVRRRLLG